MEYSYLNDTLVMLAATVLAVALCLRMRLSPILAYLAVGVIVGPFGFGLVDDVEHIRIFAEFGVVFLLFSIGLEFSVALLARMKAAVLGLGSAQVWLTAAITAAVAFLLGLKAESALVLGGIIAMSSTALVTKQLADQVELHTRHGRNSLGILLFQDLMVVPFLILVTSLSGTTADMSVLTVAIALSEAVLALLIIFVFGRWVLRPLFREVARFRAAELFTLTVLLIVLCSAWVTYSIGLSFALGAFLAGVMLSETEFRHQVESEIRPFRDLLLGLFFITIGMMLDISMLPSIWLPVVLLLVALMLFKCISVFIFCRLGDWNNAVSLRTGLILAHGGEFGFAILILAMDGGILGPNTGQVVLAAMLFSMALAPVLIRYNGRIAQFLLPRSMQRSRQEISDHLRAVSAPLNRHVIVCGYGRVGKHAVAFLTDRDMPCMAIDLEPEHVQQGLAAGYRVSYGDAGSLALLRACGLERASALVISMIDFNTAMKIISRVRAVDGELPIIVRTRKEMHLYQLYQAGATEVVADIFGSDQMLNDDILEDVLKQTVSGG
ncbi:MAG: cation:proton antiporter [Mariprofundus sp.]